MIYDCGSWRNSSAVARLTANGPQSVRLAGRTPAAEMLSWCGTTASAPWLTRAGRTAVADLVAARAGTADPHAGPGRVHERLALELMGDGHAAYDAIARQLWGLPVHAPFLDTSVVWLR
jgi:asparagine synthase (glutamine-hydrolysing)